ncbi:uncharacterized protein LOC123503596 isoform X1 [Portunus trituberculatus]|uniref:uncharacterized protein LOC123503596 isoform X1 n=1 Tax=Portunus trituberculatus TaxID=210409 RepID=UPI001E1CE630|nr:uncharacterized protein LOC123503596 isoform X1 [Portunus trituberculatus]
MSRHLTSTCALLRLVWIMHAVGGDASMNADHQGNEEASANNSTLTVSPQQMPPPPLSHQSPKANSINQDSNEASTRHTQQRTSPSNDSLNMSVPTVSNTSGNKINPVFMNASHTEKYATPNSKASRDSHAVLDTTIDIIRGIFEVVLPIVSLVFAYPACAINVRAWMDYLFGTQIVEAALGTEGLYKTILLLENPNF